MPNNLSNPSEHWMSFRQSHLRGSLLSGLHLPGDKVISHLALFLASLGRGSFSLKGLNAGEDVEQTKLALRDLGVSISEGSKNECVVQGRGGRGFKQPANPLYLGNSASTTRFLMGILAVSPLQVTLYGDTSLSHRPMKRISIPLKQVGAHFDMTDENFLPLSIQGTGQANTLHYAMPLASAQLKASLILASLGIEGISTIHEMDPTRDHIEKLLEYLEYPHFYIRPHSRGKILEIKGNQPFYGKDIQIPGDPSAAAFFTLAALLAPHSHITIKDINWNHYRRGIYKALMEMGGKIEVCNQRYHQGEEMVDLKIGSSELHNIHLDESYVPTLIDEYPILAVAAAYAHGISTFKGLRELRYKESNRLESIQKNLTLCGVEARIDCDTLIVHGNGGRSIFGGVTVNSQRDHRIAMSFYVMGILAKNPLIIQGAECIKSSFPGFRDIFKNLSFMKAA